MSTALLIHKEHAFRLCNRFIEIFEPISVFSALSRQRLSATGISDTGSFSTIVPVTIRYFQNYRTALPVVLNLKRAKQSRSPTSHFAASVPKPKEPEKYRLRAVYKIPILRI